MSDANFNKNNNKPQQLNLDTNNINSNSNINKNNNTLEMSNTTESKSTANIQDDTMLTKMQKKFTIPPPPKSLMEGAKRDYLLVGGICATAVFLSAGVWNHVKGGNSATTAKFLKGRIWAQALTVGLMGFYAFNYTQTLDDETRKKQKVILS